jgi:ribosomal protein S16
VAYWLSVGAQPSETVRALLKKSGMSVADRHQGSKPPQPKKKKKEEKGG